MARSAARLMSIYRRARPTFRPQLRFRHEGLACTAGAFANVPLSFTLKSIQQMMGRPTPITWNHRVLLIEEHGEKSYCIHEVHYDEAGSVMGWTQNAIAVFSKQDDPCNHFIFNSSPIGERFNSGVRSI